MPTEVYLGDTQIGRVVDYETGTLFEYTDSAWDLGYEPAPFLMPLQTGAGRFNDQDFDGMPPMLADSLPDSFGRKIMEDWFIKEGVSGPGPEQKLAYVGQSGIGALRYRPCREESPQIFSMAEAMEMAREYAAQRPVDLESLRRKAGTPGGAFPKILACKNPDGEITEYTGTRSKQKDLTYWLVKLAPDASLKTNRDREHSPELEAAYLNMAGDAGINVPYHELWETTRKGGGTDRHLAIQRFDIRDGQTVHTQTFAALSGKYPNLECRNDYGDMMDKIKKLSGDIRDCRQLFKRAVFNVLAENTDDHTKNFSFQVVDGKWTLAPAYDLTCSGLGAANQRAIRSTTVMGEGLFVKKRSLLKLGGKAGISDTEANADIEEIMEVLSRSRDYLRKTGCDKKVVEEVGQMIDQNNQRIGPTNIDSQNLRREPSDGPDI